MRPLFALLLAAAAASAREWPDATLDLFARVPVQEGGRVKPLSTVAAFALLRIHHKRTYEGASATEWLLDTLFFPEEARRERVFSVENDEVLDALGLPHEGRKRRDRHAYEELLPARERLLRLGHEYGRIDAKERNPVQGQLVHLAQNFVEFERPLRFLDFARRAGGEKPARDLEGADALAILPPRDGSAEWLTPRDVAAAALAGVAPAPAHVEMIGLLEDLVAQRDDPQAFQKTLGALLARAREGRDLDKIDLEVAFYRLDPFGKALALYLAAFLVVAATWIGPHPWLVRGALLLSGCALGLHATGIFLRCVLRIRPPVSTLYETVVFVGTVMVLTALATECLNRRRIGLSAAPFLGALGLFVSGRFEEIHREDTMPQLVAVLDTNFWLATHVTCITIGYAAALFASALAHVHVLGRPLGMKRGDDAFYRGIARTVYGVTCFALLFSIVGTILGGVWANESWGRFWGWDPKENGALLIVLSQLALLHGRMGGYLRDRGVCMGAVFTGCVVAFSWWGVNLLGVGLHSYGFTQGVWTGLLVFYGVEALVLLVGAVARPRPA